LRKQFALEMLLCTEEDEPYLNRTFFFSDEATFHVYEVNRHNNHIQGSENPHNVTEYEHDSLKVNVWYALMKNKDIGIFFFEKPMVTGDTFLAMMENTALHHVPVGKILVRWCTTSLLPLCLCPFGQGVF
jgi:hypothetical protein